MTKKLLSVIWALAIAVGCIPSYAFATEIQDESTVFDGILEDNLALYPSCTLPYLGVCKRTAQVTPREANDD